MNDRRVADEDEAARGTVCRQLHQQALNTHPRLPLSIFSDSRLSRDGFLLTRRVVALRAFAKTPDRSVHWEVATI